MNYFSRERALRLSRSGMVLAGVLVCHLVVSPSPARAQGNIELRMNEVQTNNCGEMLRSLIITVLGENGKHLDRQAVVKLHDVKRDLTDYQTTSTPESQTVFCEADFGTYEIEASAVGYLTEHKVLEVASTLAIRTDIILKKDPNAVDLSASDDAIPKNMRKEAQRAVDALKSANFKDAQRHLDKVYKVVPSSAQINFLYGYLFLQTKDMERSETSLARAAVLDPRRGQTLTLLGRVQLQREHFDDARKSLEQAVSDNSSDWMAHNLLGDAYLQAKDYDKARDQAQLAIATGKSAGSVANLVLGQALANVGKDKEGIQALNSFVQTNPDNPAVPQVKQLIAKIENRDANPASATPLVGADLALAAAPPELPESSWGPPGVDDVKPTVAAGVTCPTDQVIEKSGERVKQLADNITRFAAVEDMLHEQLDKTGSPITKETRKFNYVASISEDTPGNLSTDEYRDLRYGISDLPDHIVTSGFMTLALIFHPDMRDDFAMTCEGLGQWHGQATWLVYFRPRDDRPNRFADYVVGAEHYPMRLKGRAWINANDFQIVRIESDLATPLPQLSVQHQIAEYGPIKFPNQKVQLWLPQNVDIFMELNRRRYYRRHSFDHYMLFSVNSEEKSPLIKKDTAPPENR